jgi:hypothetical protein
VLFGLMLGLLAAGCLSLLIALGRVWWGARSTTPYFATACASLFFCMLTVMLARQQGPRDTHTDLGLWSDAAALPPDDGHFQVPRAAEGKASQVERNKQRFYGLYAALPQEPFVAISRDHEKETAADASAREKQVRMFMARNTQTPNTFRKGKDDQGKAKSEPDRGQARRFQDLKSRQDPQTKKDKGGGGPPGQPSPPPPAAQGGGLKKSMAEDKVPRNQWYLDPVPVEYAYFSAKELPAGAQFPDTVLWSPVLETRNGLARVSFDLPAVAATYRILVYGHSPQGRLGVAHEILQVPPPAAAKERTAKPK